MSHFQPSCRPLCTKDVRIGSPDDVFGRGLDCRTARRLLNGIFSNMEICCAESIPCWWTCGSQILSFPSAQTSEPIAVCKVSYCTLSYWLACVISSSVGSCFAMLHILANYISTLVSIRILIPNKFRIGWAQGVDCKVVDATLQSANSKTPLWLC